MPWGIGGQVSLVLVPPKESDTKLHLKDGRSGGAVPVAQGEHVRKLDLISPFKYEACLRLEGMIILRI